MTDDGGFLGLVDPHAYRSFVGEDWTLELLMERFESEMGRGTVLVWGTGGEEQWEIEVSDAPVDAGLPIFRQVTGPITVTGGELVVVNLETVTMAAQYEDSAVGDDKETYGSGIEVPNGEYLCTISQLTDPEEERTHDGPDFHLQLVAGHTAPWAGVPWSEL
ncbi:hypothetical protein [Nocardia inohanensis]|uniref:hypothetical protein n=1 Tax=Nocardia inohanensis TaxID=209246 RepID=UPI0012F9878E|nr:hypothetical protein [Nocardia inohanensis]